MNAQRCNQQVEDIEMMHINKKAEMEQVRKGACPRSSNSQRGHAPPLPDLFHFHARDANVSHSRTVPSSLAVTSARSSFMNEIALTP